MSILDKAEVRSTRRQREPDFSPLIDLSCEQTGEIRPGTSFNTEFALKVSLGVHFWANQAQYPDAYKNARRVLLHRLYGDTLGQLSELRKAIYDGDAKMALLVCDRIQSDLMDVESA